MEPTHTDEWLDVTDTKQSDILWAFRKHTYPKYIFAEEYDRKQVKDVILKTHRVKDAIEKYKRDSGVDTATAYKEAAGIIDEISHAFSLSTIRFMALILMKVIRSIFQKVLVNKDGVARFHECSKLTPIVLVPTHNSYFDFILASYLCFALDLPLPAIVAGQDFLSMAIVNQLLRGSGAFYMRRSFASDSFYRNIFTQYTQHVLCSGERPVEFFPEGTRSRNGKAIQPKLGILSMVLESYVHGYVQDVTFIPMSISYEKITEEQLYLFELLGIPKPKESLSGLLKARSILSSDFGTVSVHFGEAMSLKEYCRGKIDVTDYISIPRCERHLKIFGREAQEMKIAKYFGEKVVFLQQQDMCIFPRAVVAAIMLNTNNIKLDDLLYKVDIYGKLLDRLGCKLQSFEDILVNEVRLKKAIAYSDCTLSITHDNEVNCLYTSPTDDALRSTKLFQAFKKTPHLVTQTLSYVYLSSQRNKLMHRCVAPAILLHCISKNGDGMDKKDNFEFFKQIFKTEFIFDPDLNAEQEKGAFQTLTSKISYIISVDGHKCDVPQKNGTPQYVDVKNQYFTSTLNKLIQLDLISSLTHGGNIRINSMKQNEVDFLMNLLQPFIDAYLLVMHCLSKNTYEFPISLKLITSELQIQAAELVALMHVGPFEAISLYTLSNCVTSLCKMGLLATIKNSKFQNLVNSVNEEKLLRVRHKLARYASPSLRLFTEHARL